MNSKEQVRGHILACITILVWGTTYIATKVLLRSFEPIEILFYRFSIAYIALWIISPKCLHLNKMREEVYFIAAGICGVTLYFLFENIALTYTLASNVGVIISIAPFFTAIFACIFLKSKRPGKSFFIGFLVAMAGICILSFSSETSFKLNPLGDFLAIIAAIVWAGYSTITKKIGEFGYSTILVTRRIFFYGLVFMLPALYFMKFHFRLSRFYNTVNLCNVLFLGLGASALGFVTWNHAVKVLGAVKTSVYIYLSPVVTTITSAIILKEQFTKTAILGIILTMVGLFMSEGNKFMKFKKKDGNIDEICDRVS